MGGIFSSPDPVRPPAAPTKTSAEIAQAEADQRRKLANARGRQSTLLGGSVGAQTEQKRLLGQ